MSGIATPTCESQRRPTFELRPVDVHGRRKRLAKSRRAQISFQ